MEIKRGKTVFIEYSSAEKGQHFMTVVQTQDHKRIIIGRIYREYDNEKKKTQYRATDFQGNQVFVDYKDIYTLKKKFIEYGQSLAMAIPSIPKPSRLKGVLSHPHSAKRINELKTIREKNPTKAISKTNSNVKTNDIKEKELDSKNPERYKEIEKARGKNTEEHLKENIEPEVEKPNREELIETEMSNNETQNDTVQDIDISEREAELDQIREENEERDQDMDRDL